MTFIETLLAMSVTGMVGGAITTMMAAVTDEISANEGARSSLIRSGLTQSRISSYVARAHCALDLTDTAVTLWLEDSRESGTVHASEVRWISLDPVQGVVEAQFICFPETWSESTRLQADTEYLNPHAVNWPSIRASFEARDLICTMPIVEGVTALSISGNASDPSDVTLIETTLTLTLDDRSHQTVTAESIRVHRRPGEDD